MTDSSSSNLTKQERVVFHYLLLLSFGSAIYRSFGCDNENKAKSKLKCCLAMPSVSMSLFTEFLFPKLITFCSITYLDEEVFVFPFIFSNGSDKK